MGPFDMMDGSRHRWPVGDNLNRHALSHHIFDAATRALGAVCCIADDRPSFALLSSLADAIRNAGPL